jgi:hypothetical protein
MKNYLLFLSTCVFMTTTHLTQAQNDSTLTQGKKNEFGVNIGPAILVMMGASPYSQPLSLTYKRRFNKWAVRANFAYMPYLNPFYNSTTDKTKINDTTLQWRTTNLTSKRFSSRLGVEYRRPMRWGWTLVTGVDIQQQQLIDKRIVSLATFKIDSIGKVGTADEFYALTLRSQKNTFEEIRTANQVGLGFTLGALIPINKKWLVMTQFRADGVMGPTVIKSTDLLTGATTRKTMNTFDFNTGALFSEVSLFYRF